jgi:hypothetical protein
MDYFRVIPNSFIGLRKKRMRNISERNVATSDYVLEKYIYLVLGENWSNFPVVVRPVN